MSTQAARQSFPGGRVPEKWLRPSTLGAVGDETSPGTKAPIRTKKPTRKEVKKKEWRLVVVTPTVLLRDSCWSHHCCPPTESKGSIRHVEDEQPQHWRCTIEVWPERCWLYISTRSTKVLCFQNSQTETWPMRPFLIQMCGLCSGSKCSCKCPHKIWHRSDHQLSARLHSPLSVQNTGTCFHLTTKNPSLLK